MDGTFALTESDQGNEAPPINTSEEKELKRVFDMLCDFNERAKLSQEIRELEDSQTQATQKMNAQIASGIQVNVNRMDSNAQAALQRMEQLKNEINVLESNPNKKITCADVTEILKKIGYKPQRGEVEEMIWAVDEDLDMALNWLEFKLLFGRNLADTTGLEPSKMYHLTQFLIYDRNENGLVSVDETMNMLYARYGRSKMEVKLKELFGEDLKETGREGGEINYTRFIKAVEKTQLSLFWGTSKGKILLNRGGLKK